MKFLIDENIDFRFAKKLQKQGHGVTRLSKGMADREVLLKAQKEKSIFLTNDHDFANRFAYNPKDYFGIIIFQLYNASPQTYLTATLKFLKKFSEKEIKGKTILVSSKGYNILF